MFLVYGCTVYHKPGKSIWLLMLSWVGALCTGCQLDLGICTICSIGIGTGLPPSTIFLSTVATRFRSTIASPFVIPFLFPRLLYELELSPSITWKNKYFCFTVQYVIQKIPNPIELRKNMQPNRFPLFIIFVKHACFLRYKFPVKKCQISLSMAILCF